MRVRRAAWWLAAGGVLGAAFWSVSACDSGLTGTCVDDAVCSKDGGADSGVTCDPSKVPSCVDNGSGIFVSLTGDDSAAGTKESPVRSIQTALTKAASASKSRVYVCEGTYAEKVKIDRAISVYGGFACGGWTYTGAKAKIAPGEPGTALEVRNAAGAIELADLEVTAKSAATAGESSIAGWFAQSGGVTLRRVVLTAGTGADANPTPASISDWVPPKAPDGNDADGGPGGEQPNPCSGLSAPSDRSVGGAGGARNSDGGSGLPKIPPKPEAAYTGAGGDTTKTLCDGAARPGAFGAGGAQAAEGGALGQVTATGYLPPNGATGGNGVTGQGGGGGAGKGGTGYGSGGGAGGCGGKGGGGGQAGGSSIALLVYRTKVTLVETTLHASQGGKGGPGGKGQKAQEAGGLGRPASGGCPGAQGGHGGSGAGGNGGAGGSSLDLAYSGDAPSIDGGDVTDRDSLADKGWTLASSPSNGGSAGEKGDKVVAESDDGQPGRPGPSGTAKAVVALP